MTTEALFRHDPYLTSTQATVTAVHEDGGLEFDRTCFYAASGGQPGDVGFLERPDGSRVELAEARTGETKSIIIHVPVEGQVLPLLGEKVTLTIDWPRRYKLMRMHTACHLLSVVCPYPITGASVGEDESRIDIDMVDVPDKAELTEKLMKLVEEDHAVYVQWITEEELAANPGLVKSKNVRPPVGLGRISLVCIGDDASVDSQPCGGTHVARTGEVGPIHVGKIEKKGKENRRFRLRFGALPANG